MGSFDHCMTSLKLGDKIATDELKKAADQYQADGMARPAALLRAAEDQLELARMEERTIVKAVRTAYEARGGKAKAVKPTPAPLDHGELNIPGRTNGINAELDKFKAEQAKEAKTEAKSASAQKKLDKARARELFDEVADDIVAKNGARFGVKELRNELDQMVKWEPGKFIKLAEKFKNEQAAQAEPKPAAVDNPPAPKKAKKPTTTQAEHDAQLADYFAVGNVVRAYAGHDRVLAYQPATKENGYQFSVEVQHVIEQDGQWIQDPKDDRIRTHSTMPDAAKLKAGPVERAAVASTAAPTVMDEETYLATNGASRQDFGDAALHRSSSNVSNKQRTDSIDRQADKDTDLAQRRAELREEYRAMVDRGEIRPPTSKEKTISAANGQPDLESTQAARRIAEKRGWDWQQDGSQAGDVHEEGGQAEQATPAVIAESIAKSARNTPMNMKQAKEQLIDDIDAAIKARKKADDDIAHLDGPAWKKANDAMLDAMESRLTFDVEGDGKFTVRNKVENLENFRKKISTSSGFSTTKSKGFAGVPFAPAKAATSSTINQMMADGEQMAAYELAEVSGAPFRFTPNSKSAVPNVWIEARDIDNMPHDFKGFIGRLHGVSGAAWAFVDGQTGSTVGGYFKTAKEVEQGARAAIKKAGAEKVAEARASAVAMDEAALKNTWVEAAEKSDASITRTTHLRASTNGAPTLEGVRAAWADAGIKNFISEKKGTIHLSQIVVPQAERGSGKGTAAMQQLLDYADRTGQRIVLSPSADFGGNKARLVDFYKKQGFVENKGRNKDFEISESMYREPAQLRASAGRTVEVDGVRRPITNSRGKLVGQGFKEQTAFWKWFGDSKAVDEHGRPIVLYHGTDVAEQFGEFAPGSFFTTAPREASAYARPGDFARRQVAAGKYVVAEGIAHAGEMIPYYGSISEIPDPAIGKVYATDNGVFRALGKGKWEVFSDLLVDYDKSKGDDISVVAGDFSEEAHSVVTEYDNFVRESFPGGDGGRVVPAYVSLKNPVRLNALEANRLGLRLGATRESIQAAIDKYEQLGHDGIVTESDEASMFSDMADDLGGVPAQYIVFRPQQVKSATGNAGTFDGTNPDITASTSAAASAMDTSVAGMIQEGTSVKAVLAEIAARSSDKNFQALATALQAQNLKTGLLFERAQGTYSAGVDASMATASYRASTDTAYLHQAEGAEQNVLHELVHAATLKALAKGGLAATQIRALWSHVRAMPNFKNEYGIVNEEEFVAEAYTSPRFRQMLADTPAPGVKLSLWQKFVGAVKILLGRPAVADSVLDRVMTAGPALMAENRDAAPAGADLRASVAGNVHDYMQRFGASSEASNRVADLFASEKTFNSWWHKTVGTQYHKAQVDADFKRVYDGTQRYLSSVSVIANQSADLAPTLLPKMEGLRDLAKKAVTKTDAAATAGAVFAGTLTDQRVYTDAELRNDHNLTPHQIQLYREFRAATDKSLDDLGKTDLIRLAGTQMEHLRDQVMDAADVAAAAELLATEAGANSDLAADFRDKAATVDKLKKEGYAPLMRFGEHTVYVTAPNGEQLYFGMEESASAAARLARDMQEIYPDATVVKGVMSTEGSKLFSGISPDTIEVFSNVTGLSQDPLFQNYLRLVVNNRSALKRLIHRKGVAGFSQDTTRVLASFLTSNARAGAKNLHAGEMMEAAQAIPKEKGDVRDEAIKLVHYIQNPVDEAAKIRGLLFTNFIGGSIASAMVNLTQPVVQTLPYLAQWGTAKATGRLASAMKMAAMGDDSIQDPVLRQALIDAEKQGIVSPQEIHNLQAEAMRESNGLSIGGKEIIPAFALRKAAVVWGSAFGLAEQFNRKVTFIAAYQTARDMTPEQLGKAGVTNAIEFAGKAIAETQGVYNRGNRPDWARGAVGATLMTFKQFGISYLEFIKRLPPQQRALALAILFVAAGMNGLPFADDLDDVLDTIAQALGYNWQAKKARDKFLTQTLGKGGAAFVQHGFSGVSGIPLDVSMRMGMGNLLPSTGVFLKTNADKSQQYSELLGAAGGLAQRVIKSTDALLTGDMGRAGAAIAPTAIANVMKGMDMLDTGAYRDGKGRKVVDTDGLDAVIKMIGFQPAKVAQEQQHLEMARDSIAAAKAVETAIADAWAQRAYEKDPKAAMEARAAILEWNEKNPDSRISVDMSQITRRLREMRKSKAERVVRTAPKETRAQWREELKN